MNLASATAWPISDLSESDLAAIDKAKWTVFPRDTVARITMAWNAGMKTADMARDLECRPGSLRVLIGKLTQIGVKVRRANEPAAARVAQIKARSPLAEQMGAQQMKRLRRLAEFDPAARRALDLHERGERA
jgi:hypothetical protein